MASLELTKVNKRKTFWRMVRSIFFSQKASVTNKVRRRSTFEKPKSYYCYPVVRKVRTRRKSSTSVEDVPVNDISTDSNQVPPPPQLEEQTLHTIAEIEANLGNLAIASNDDNNNFSERKSLPLPLYPPSTLTVEVEVERNIIEPPAPAQERSLNDTILSLFEQAEFGTSANKFNRCSITSLSDGLQNNTLLDAGVQRDDNSNVREIQPRGNDPNNVREQNSECNKRFSIEINPIPPITLRYIPSGLQVDDRVVWAAENETQNGTVRWIGKIRDYFYAGVELDNPVGNSSGIYGYGNGLYRRLFTCKLPYGRFIPVKELVLYSDFHDNGLKAGIICVICRDDFLDNWEPSMEVEQDAHSSRMVATKTCGHLFHYGCLNQWFNKKKYDHQPCPYCQSPMDRNEVIRIFPTQF